MLVKVFACAVRNEGTAMESVISDWLRENPTVEIVTVTSTALNSTATRDWFFVTVFYKKT